MPRLGKKVSLEAPSLQEVKEDRQKSFIPYDFKRENLEPARVTYKDMLDHTTGLKYRVVKKVVAGTPKYFVNNTVSSTGKRVGEVIKIYRSRAGVRQLLVKTLKDTNEGRRQRVHLKELGIPGA